MAAHGLSTGGRAPYGYSRSLVGPDDTFVQWLEHGEVWINPPENRTHVRTLWPPRGSRLFRRCLKVIDTFRSGCQRSVAAAFLDP
jgi:hypothetical protein